MFGLFLLTLLHSHFFLFLLFENMCWHWLFNHNIDSNYRQQQRFCLPHWKRVGSGIRLFRWKKSSFSLPLPPPPHTHTLDSSQYLQEETSGDCSCVLIWRCQDPKVHLTVPKTMQTIYYICCLVQVWNTRHCHWMSWLNIFRAELNYLTVDQWSWK